MKPDPMDTSVLRPARSSLMRRLLGDEPWLLLVMVLVCVLGMLALSDSVLWPMLGAVLVAILARTLLWGQLRGEGRATDADEGQP